jgi:hypothetical protein
MNFKKSISSAIAVIAVLVSSTCFAQVNLPEGGASGHWYNPARDGEGIFVEIIQAGSGSSITVGWYTYDLDGFQMWLTGTVALEANSTSATIPVVVTNGPNFGTAYDPTDLAKTTWGTLTLVFDSCSTGLLSYLPSSPDFGTGAITLTRLTNLEQVRCTEPPPVTGPTSQRWSGPGVCFNVSADGRTLTSDGSTCDNGRAFDSDIDSVNSVNGDPCDAEVQCQGVIAIVDGSFSCTSTGEIAFGTFTSNTSASGAAQEAETVGVCLGEWTATPDNP